MKKFVIAAGGIAAGVSLYKLGQLVGAIKITKGIVDGADEIIPGFKEHLVSKTTDVVIDKMFHENHEEVEE